MSNLQFAPGETDVVQESFSPSVILFWLRTSVGASSTRVVARQTNSALGLIPLGSKDIAYPLSNVAGVGVNTRFHLGRLVAGVINLLIAYPCLSNATSSGLLLVIGLIFLVFGVAALVNMFTATLTVQNNGGGVAVIGVSILEKAKLEALREQINQRLFADQALLRHNQHMQVQNQQLSVQQQQLNAQVMQQSAYLQSQQPQSGAPAPQPPAVPQRRSPTGFDPALLSGGTSQVAPQPPSAPSPKAYSPSWQAPAQPNPPQSSAPTPQPPTPPSAPPPQQPPTGTPSTKPYKPSY
ncbi:hypothetical protein [Tsukamurella pseudospumae]|uniref:Uncharacterized protein n=1 Tax=Tsukamurella pseudospumae TaxID=239498 RepID=A0A138ATW9_9ACTN|nr:hypothetical protein [Tsukamurella pseudospumae]KXP13907.1 hypothetical protein AXK60_22650 [Tsukamurella pseudospumae]